MLYTEANIAVDVVIKSSLTSVEELKYRLDGYNEEIKSGILLHFTPS
jgi:hypothetical protein